MYKKLSSKQLFIIIVITTIIIVTALSRVANIATPTCKDNFNHISEKYSMSQLSHLKVVEYDMSCTTNNHKI